MLPELVKQKIEENKSAMLDTLQTLIGIPSVATAEPENGTPYGCLLYTSPSPRDRG